MEADFVEAIFYGGHGHVGLCRCPLMRLAVLVRAIVASLVM